MGHKTKLLKISGAVILMLLSICIGAGGYYLVEIKERSEQNTELNYIQEGDIKIAALQRKQLNETLLQVLEKLGTLDSVCTVLNRMDAKLGVLVNGY